MSEIEATLLRLHLEALLERARASLRRQSGRDDDVDLD